MLVEDSETLACIADIVGVEREKAWNCPLQKLTFSARSVLPFYHIILARFLQFSCVAQAST